MPGSDSFHEAMAGLESKDPSKRNAAADKICQLLGDRLLKQAEWNLNKQMQQKLDPVDMVQSALGSFVRQHKAKTIHKLESWQDLTCWLVAVTRNKCAHRAKDLKRDLQDLSLTVPDGQREFPDVEPTPEQAACQRDLQQQIGRLFEKLDEDQCRVLELLWEGEFTYSQIADDVNRSVRYVSRVKEKAAEILIRLGVDPPRPKREPRPSEGTDSGPETAPQTDP